MASSVAGRRENLSDAAHLAHPIQGGKTGLSGVPAYKLTALRGRQDSNSGPGELSRANSRFNSASGVNDPSAST